jgi:hypothetical protein
VTLTTVARSAGGDTELVSQTLASWGGEKHQVEVPPLRRRCPTCAGHAGLGEPVDALAAAWRLTRAVNGCSAGSEPRPHTGDAE